MEAMEWGNRVHLARVFGRLNIEISDLCSTTKAIHKTLEVSI